jgi:uncharacterized protein (TIRG00374 family)
VNLAASSVDVRVRVMDLPSRLPMMAAGASPEGDSMDKPLESAGERCERGVKAIDKARPEKTVPARVPGSPDDGGAADEPLVPGAPGRASPSRPVVHDIQTIATRVGVIALTGVALYVVLPSVTRVVGAWPELSHLSPLWLMVALLAEVASFACAFALQRLVLRTKKWFAVVAAGLAGNAVSSVLPGGAGAAVQFRMLDTAGIKADDAAGGMTASSLLGVGGLLALPIFALPAILGGASVSPGLVHAALLGLAGFALFIVCGVVVMATDRPLIVIGRAAERIWNRVRHRPKISGLDQRLLRERDDIRSTLGHNWRRAIVLSGGRLGCDYFCLLGCLRATGTSARPSVVLLAYAAAGIVALVPLTPDGVGVVEASLSGLLVLAGVRAGDAFLATLAYRLASYWLPLVAGTIAYLLFRHRYPPAGQAPRLRSNP